VSSRSTYGLALIAFNRGGKITLGSCRNILTALQLANLRTETETVSLSNNAVIARMLLRDFSEHNPKISTARLENDLHDNNVPLAKF